MHASISLVAAVLLAAPAGLENTELLSSPGKGLVCPRRYDVERLDALKLQFRGPPVKDTQEVDGDLLLSLDSATIEAISLAKWRDTDPKTLEEAVEKETVHGGKEVAKAATPGGWTLTVAQKDAGRDVWEVVARRALGKQAWKCMGRATSLAGAEDLARACASLSPLGAKMAPNPKLPKGCIVGDARGLGALGPKCGDDQPCPKKE